MSLRSSWTNLGLLTRFESWNLNFRTGDTRREELEEVEEVLERGASSAWHTHGPCGEPRGGGPGSSYSTRVEPSSTHSTHSTQIERLSLSYYTERQSFWL